MTINPSLMQYNAMQQYNAYNAAMLNPALVRRLSSWLSINFNIKFLRYIFLVLLKSFNGNKTIKLGFKVGYELAGYAFLIIQFLAFLNIFFNLYLCV